MPLVKLRAWTICNAFEQAQSELVGKAVVLTDGKAGTVESVWLDELHGLRIRLPAMTGNGRSLLSNLRRTRGALAPRQAQWYESQIKGAHP